MIQINIKAISESSDSLKSSVNCSDDYIPLEIQIGDSCSYGETFSISNLSDENFCEVRFRDTDLSLYEITVKAIDPRTINHDLKSLSILSEKKNGAQPVRISASEIAHQKRFEYPVTIIESENSFCYLFHSADIEICRVYQIAEQVFVLVQEDDFWTGFIVDNVDTKLIV